MSPSWANHYKLLLNNPVGSGADQVARKLSQLVKEQSNINLIVINQGGGGGLMMARDFKSEKLAVVLYALGAISLFGLYANLKNHSKAKLTSYVALLIAIVGVVLAKSVGTSGGEIRHTEIRANIQKAQGSEVEDNE